MGLESAELDERTSEYCPDEYRRIDDRGSASRHDWRLWKRERVKVITAPPGTFEWWETWYCTRCRRIDERTTT